MLLVKMHKPIRFVRADLMPLLPQFDSCLGLQKTFTGKNKRDVPLLVQEKLARSE